MNVQIIFYSDLLPESISKACADLNIIYRHLAPKKYLLEGQIGKLMIAAHWLGAAYGYNMHSFKVIGIEK